MRYLVLIEVIELHRQIIEQSGGALGIRDLGALESALAQPHMTFGGEELYPTLVDKASAIGFSLVMNHPFIDGNKRIGHAAMEVFLVMNGVEIDASVDEQESIFLSLASGKLKREAFTDWLKSHVKVR
ncbi:MAG: type II toxin-antitoxin system death-on-curing family toxin [Richelia sp. RM2_1_2]|nr:type II toxin-antitoxin system death-on-curing family toxin [Richelia sp. SM2_1_7]NJM21355.1 type II toxin-antitoxin system death-on-curing family toxin [Richelia sp. SM1_7_0]NJN12679.1 type II toxin-antitoxin system death-on-curing family toxin [Richelia sp. RM1_1_1]NJO27791.1 type II toxin-antitoxin system death-on-curing family toxin [Richelia sp. SL_2_1]NJO63332.1 type II toxin-antitoxin system death-on-curing family toxin [Richelia sp. RM2_1_2]